MLNHQTLQQLFKDFKEPILEGRYINNQHILPLINALTGHFKIEQIGSSVFNKPIYSIVLGNGSKRILMWSQMHGNESTTTKAVFDIINVFNAKSSKELISILKNCTINIIPILNPDGAEAYTRINANEVDLNRDAKDLTQPESEVLREVFESFKPHFCFNLHGQRTIFSAGNTNKPATVSFLSPAQDIDRTITSTRKKAMEIIVAMNAMLQQQIPGQVGRYDDGFNINCVGDMFQSLGVPTVLFEAGHFADDYQREQTREFIFQSILTAISYISDNEVDGSDCQLYFDIPENQKLFYDILVKQADYNGDLVDVGIQFEEVLKEGKIHFVPILKQAEKLSAYFGHREILADKNEVKINKNEENEVFEIVIVNKLGEFFVINLI